MIFVMSITKVKIKLHRTHRLVTTMNRSSGRPIKYSKNFKFRGGRSSSSRSSMSRDTGCTTSFGIFFFLINEKWLTMLEILITVQNFHAE